MYTINCNGKILALDTPALMGIINITPDSFYKGHMSLGIIELVAMAEKMVVEGAAIIDIGGQSTRPGSKMIGEAEEMQRVLPVIEAIHQKDPSMIISVDTFYSSVAAAACKAGASMVNDISSGTIDRDMLSTVAGLNLPYVCMHLKGLPGTMQAEPLYDDVVQEVLEFFIQRLEACRAAGITDMIIDPGFGFGKTIEHNFTLLKNLSVFRMLGKPLLAGLSRKSTVYKTLGITATEALNGTSVLNTLALHNGASILRVHDVKEAKEAVTLFNAYKKAPPQRGAFPM